MYEPDGHMCANLMDPDRPAWKDPASGTEKEKAESLDGMAAYCGTYKLDQAHQRVIHYPEVAWTPQYVGTIQYRPFRIEGNRLTITPESTNGPKLVLVWERAPAK